MIIEFSKPRLPCGVFDKISILPDPVPHDNGHYKEFKDFGTETTEDHRLLLHNRLHREKSVPLPVSIQHGRNTKMALQCEGCEM